jgi:hypothetical protein
MSNTNTYQSLYWNELVQLKSHIYYLDEYLSLTVKIDRWVNGLLAFTSSTSIATWAVWQRYQLLWACLIGVSQVVTALKPLLPYESRRKAISALLPELNDLWLFAGRNWFSVSKGKLTEEQVNNLVFDVRQKKEATIQKHLTSTSLPDNEGCVEKAKAKTKIYFRDTYQVEV